ncbi:hypothetical protein ABTY59_11980 [Streptomyces sp. NPDC096079]|uniref:hypothetical protein n=1 Tax=Streptomyces sp. NPDC096079 TaxID=3155820 RepID=UPI00332513A4
MASRTRRRLLVGLVGTLATVLSAATLAAASPSTTGATAALGVTTTEDTAPFALEDFSYPGAARVLTLEGISLKRGDGHITLAACNTTVDQIMVHTIADPSVGRKQTYCFEANAAIGYLSLDLPRVIALESTGPSFSASLTAGEEKSTVKVPKEGFLSVGEGDLSSGKRSVLVEIRLAS